MNGMVYDLRGMGICIAPRYELMAEPGTTWKFVCLAVFQAIYNAAIEEFEHDIAFIQGPPGTGKTTIITLLQILSHLGHSWITCTPSNSVTDYLVTVFKQKCPKMGTIRFHLYENKARAIRR